MRTMQEGKHAREQARKMNSEVFALLKFAQQRRNVVKHSPKKRERKINARVKVPISNSKARHVKTLLVDSGSSL